VKNVFLTHERSLVRKLREAWLALRVERAHTKDEILEAYLNTIYLGQRGPVSVVGVDAAARHYFGHSARTLDLGESALVAGMIRGPGYYSPFTHPERALERRARVLAKLEKAKLISAKEAAAAAKRPLGKVAKPPAAARPAWFLAKLERDLAAELPRLDLREDRVAVFTGLDGQLQLEAERAVRRGSEELEAAYPRLRRAGSKLQAALVALDPTSGAILAYVGGRSFGESQFDRVAQARRQPGSAFKPVVLLAALRRGADGAPAFTLASLLDDAPLEVETPQGPWRPANYEKDFRGLVPLRRALEDSLNVPFVRVGLALGPEAIVEVAERMGIESPLEPVPSLALGAGEVSPLGWRVPTRCSRTAASASHRAPPSTSPTQRARCSPSRRQRASVPSTPPRSHSSPPRSRARSTAAPATRCARSATTALWPARPAPPTMRATPGSSATRRNWWRPCGSASTRASRSASPVRAPHSPFLRAS